MHPTDIGRWFAGNFATNGGILLTFDQHLINRTVIPGNILKEGHLDAVLQLVHILKVTRAIVVAGQRFARIQKAQLQWIGSRTESIVSSMFRIMFVDRLASRIDPLQIGEECGLLIGSRTGQQEWPLFGCIGFRSGWQNFKKNWAFGSKWTCKRREKID